MSPFAQIDLSQHPAPIDESIVFKNHRLGKLVEEFVFHQLKSQESVTWICDNLQIQDGKQTVGELDALYYDGDVLVHLEVAYKFYLYDTLGDYDHALKQWTGPNRKDKLYFKLGKLHERQFPLLVNPLTKTYLEGYNLASSEVVQRHCFKAQLFLPYQDQDVNLGPLNRDCVAGFYLSYRDIGLLKEFAFFVPRKLDWLVAPHLEVDWLGYSAALAVVGAEIGVGRSPLIWIKQDDLELGKGFVTFW